MFLCTNLVARLYVLPISFGICIPFHCIGTPLSYRHCVVNITKCWYRCQLASVSSFFYHCSLNSLLSQRWYYLRFNRFCDDTSVFYVTLLSCLNRSLYFVMSTLFNIHIFVLSALLISFVIDSFYCLGTWIYDYGPSSHRCWHRCCLCR